MPETSTEQRCSFGGVSAQQLMGNTNKVGTDIGKPSMRRWSNTSASTSSSSFSGVTTSCSSSLDDSASPAPPSGTTNYNPKLFQNEGSDFICNCSALENSRRTSSSFAPPMLSGITKAFLNEESLGRMASEVNIDSEVKTCCHRTLRLESPGSMTPPKLYLLPRKMLTPPLPPKIEYVAPQPLLQMLAKPWAVVQRKADIEEEQPFPMSFGETAYDNFVDLEVEYHGGSATGEGIVSQPGSPSRRARSRSSSLESYVGSLSGHASPESAYRSANRARGAGSRCRLGSGSSLHVSGSLLHRDESLLFELED